MFLYPPSFLDAPMFLYIFLYISLHSYLVFANNLIGAYILRLFRLRLIIVVMIMYDVFHDCY
jgi:hypothetical protein